LPPLTHAGAYYGDERVNLLAGVDLRPGARHRFEERWGAPGYEHVGDALSLEPTIVSVATPPAGRLDVVKQVLEAESTAAIWLEKPMAATLREAEMIAHAAGERGVAVQVNFLRRFDPVHRSIAERLIDDRSNIHMVFRYSGTLLNFGSHAIDLFRWFAGDPVWAEALQGPGEHPLVFLRSEHGATAIVFRVPVDEVVIFDVDIVTPDARIGIGAVGEQVTIAPRAPSALFVGVDEHRFARHQFQEGGIAEAFPSALSDLIACVRDGTPLRCTADDGVAALRVHEAILESLNTRSPVELQTR
jgi:predicted dehydrogenase